VEHEPPPPPDLREHDPPDVPRALFALAASRSAAFCAFSACLAACLAAFWASFMAFSWALDMDMAAVDGFDDEDA